MYNSVMLNSVGMGNDTDSVSRARHMTVGECAARLGLKVCTVRKLILTRRIGFTKLGRAVRIPETEVVRLIEAGFRPPIGPYSSG